MKSARAQVDAETVEDLYSRANNRPLHSAPGAVIEVVVGHADADLKRDAAHLRRWSNLSVNLYSQNQKQERREPGRKNGFQSHDLSSIDKKTAS